MLSSDQSRAIPDQPTKRRRPGEDPRRALAVGRHLERRLLPVCRPRGVNIRPARTCTARARGARRERDGRAGDDDVERQQQVRLRRADVTGIRAGAQTSTATGERPRHADEAPARSPPRPRRRRRRLRRRRGGGPTARARPRAARSRPPTPPSPATRQPAAGATRSTERPSAPTTPPRRASLGASSDDHGRFRRMPRRRDVQAVAAGLARGTQPERVRALLPRPRSNSQLISWRR